MTDDEQHRRNLIDYVMATCVRVRLDDPVIACDWCLENVGEQRPHHPLGEAQAGYMDYFDGEWAYRLENHPDGSGLYNFWFWTLRDATAFALRFGRA